MLRIRNDYQGGINVKNKQISKNEFILRTNQADMMRFYIDMKKDLREILKYIL